MVNWVVKLDFVVGCGFGLKMGVLKVEDLEGVEVELVSLPFRQIMRRLKRFYGSASRADREKERGREKSS